MIGATLSGNGNRVTDCVLETACGESPEWPEADAPPRWYPTCTLRVVTALERDKEGHPWHKVISAYPIPD